MFRVLTDEEAENVVRWQAPDLSGSAANVVKTREWSAPVLSNVDKPERSIKLSDTASTLTTNTLTSAPALQASHALDRPIPTTHMPMPSPSVEMLQASYDDGYARGYAEGNVALKQQSVKELNAILASISKSTARPDNATLQHEVVALSMDIARLLLRREVSVDSNAMVRLVEAGLEQIPALRNGQRRVRLHPLDANLVRDAMTENVAVDVVDDPLLQRGDCKIESGASTMHSGVDDWLEGIARDLGIVKTVPQSTVGDAASGNTGTGSFG